MLNNAEVKQARPVGAGDITRQRYNLVITLTIVWGFVLDFILCKTVGNILTPIMSSGVIGLLGVLIGFIAITVFASSLVHKSDDYRISLVGFTIIAAAMGLLLACIVQCYTAETITSAFLMTGLICLIIGLISSIFPDFFLSLGKGLFITLLITIIAEFIVILVTKSDPVFFDYLVILIFSGYFGYDLVKAQKYAPTMDNAVDSAADLYIDIVNIFVRVLAIMGRN